MKRFPAVVLCSIVLSLSLNAADSPDLQTLSRIRQEGFRNSKVMSYAQSLTDTLGGRLTGSPNAKRANEWTRDTLAQMGLANAHLEPFKFGRGWTSDYVFVRMLTPEPQQLYAIPMAWSPATNGLVHAKVTKAKLESKDDFEKFKGKLAGAIVLISEPKEMLPQEKPYLTRYTSHELEELGDYAIPSERDMSRTRDSMKRREFRKAIAQFAMDEKIAAIIQPGRGEAGVFAVQSSGTWRDDEPIGVPTVGLAPEHYARIWRLLDNKTDVDMELELRSRFSNGPDAWTTIAELPGGSKKDEVVMLGAHLDSWHTSTGATDNAAGVAVMMEAMRILKALNVSPKRTIRIALWTGEEQGLLGSRAYVEQHFAKRDDPKDPEQAKLPFSARTEKGELHLKPEHAKLSAYFNVDNGTGKIRGIYAQENAVIAPLFASWLTPLHDLGATTVTMRNTGSTDHVPFDEVGLPGFQFIQDQVEYESRTHHTNWDSFERLQREDLMQAAVVVASFVWQTANRD
ncbi:MAG: M20/M25/M40 family metallo-hydrolase, partial [Acidobacteriota bacterium]|nr:M20/M25/M40 family metallo-hydrolase [Acidobacteriota bacterium]